MATTDVRLVAASFGGDTARASSLIKTFPLIANGLSANLRPSRQLYGVAMAAKKPAKTEDAPVVVVSAVLAPGNDQHDVAPAAVVLAAPEPHPSGLPEPIASMIGEFCAIDPVDGEVPTWTVTMKDGGAKPGRPCCDIRAISAPDAKVPMYEVKIGHETWIGPAQETAEYVRSHSMVLRGR